MNDLSILNPQSTARHGWFVYGLVRSLQPENVLEIGPFHGYMTALIAKALNENEKGRVLTIDTFTHADSLSGMDELKRNIESCGIPTDRVDFVKGYAMDVPWPEHIDLAILDGNRQLPYFKGELAKVIASGVRAFCVHDTQYDSHPYWFMKQFTEKMFPAWHVIDFIYDAGFAVAMRTVDGPMTGWKPEEQHPLFGMELP